MKSRTFVARCCRAVWTVETPTLSFLAMAVNSLPWLIILTMEFSRGAKRYLWPMLLNLNDLRQ